MVLCVSVSSCSSGEPGARDDVPFAPEYLSTEVQVLDNDLVQVEVSMKGAREARDIAAFADCVLAGYADIRGFGFARHVRTQAEEEAGVWRADAVYTVSAALPAGLRTIDVEAQLNACDVKEIPQLVRSNG